MGREVKRVPLDFDWPLDKTWSGYLMPDSLHLPQCGACTGSGQTASRHWVDAIATLLLQLGEDQEAQRRERPMHPYLRGVQQSMWRPMVRPGPDALELSTGLAGREPSFLGHDSLDSWQAAKAIITAAGLDPEKWGVCPVCSGKGHIATPEQEAAHEAWERTEPPAGDGWQLWETVSEGSPVTPVFATAALLVDHLATVGDHPGHIKPMSRAAAAALVQEGWAPSGVGITCSVDVGGEAVPAGGAFFTGGDGLLALEGDPEATPHRPGED